MSSDALCVTLSPSLQTTYPTFPMTIASDAVEPFSTVTNYVSINSPAATGLVKKDPNGALSVPPFPSASSSRRTEWVELWLYYLQRDYEGAYEDIAALTPTSLLPGPWDFPFSSHKIGKSFHRPLANFAISV